MKSIVPKGIMTDRISQHCRELTMLTILLKLSKGGSKEVVGLGVHAPARPPDRMLKNANMGVTDQSVTQNVLKFGHGMVHDRHEVRFFSRLLSRFQVVSQIRE
jgi:hypothetical protein